MNMALYDNAIGELATAQHLLENDETNRHLVTGLIELAEAIKADSLKLHRKLDNIESTLNSLR